MILALLSKLRAADLFNVIALLMIAALFWLVYQMGRDHKADADRERTLRALEKRGKVESEIRGMTDEDLADRLAR